MIPQNYPLQKMIEASQRMIMMNRQEGEELGNESSLLLMQQQ